MTAGDEERGRGRARGRRGGGGDEGKKEEDAEVIHLHEIQASSRFATPENYEDAGKHHAPEIAPEISKKKIQRLLHEEQTRRVFSAAFLAFAAATPFCAIETASLLLPAPTFLAKTPEVGAVFFATFYAMPVQSALKAALFLADAEMRRKSKDDTRRRRLMEEAGM